MIVIEGDRFCLRAIAGSYLASSGVVKAGDRFDSQNPKKDRRVGWVRIWFAGRGVFVAGEKIVFDPRCAT